MFQTSGDEQGLNLISKDLLRICHGLPTDYPGSNRSSPDRRSVAFRRQIRESVTGLKSVWFLASASYIDFFKQDCHLDIQFDMAGGLGSPLAYRESNLSI